MKKIQTFEEACTIKGIDPVKNLPDVSTIPIELQKPIINHFKRLIISEAINDGWKPDYTNRNQPKYFPWFEVEADNERPAGFGFSHSIYDSWPANSSVGSRLCFETAEAALYMGEQFKELFIEEFFPTK